MSHLRKKIQGVPIEILYPAFIIPLFFDRFDDFTRVCTKRQSIVRLTI